MSAGIVSICIPVYNAERQIGQTLESVARQTYRDIEIIVTDNNSSDATGRIVEAFMHSDRRIAYYRNKTNIGMVDNWNKAIGYASGDYVKLLCADDVLAEDCIEQQVKAFLEHRSAVLVSNNVWIIDDHSRELGRRRYVGSTQLIDGLRLAKRSFLVRNIIGEPSSVLLRRSILGEVGDFDNKLKYIPDLDMWLRIMYHGDVVYISECLSSYRVSKKSMTNALAREGRKVLRNDDRYLVEKHEALGVMKLSQWDVMRHGLNFRLRRAMRDAFYFFFVH